MTDLAQIALDFCRTCLGWDHPMDRRHADTKRNAAGDGPYRAWTPYVFDFYGKHDQFHYTNLNAVMDAVRRWRDQTQDALDEYVTVTLSCASGQYIGHAFIGRGKPTTVASDSPCHALMASCIEAQRKRGAKP